MDELTPRELASALVEGIRSTAEITDADGNIVATAGWEGRHTLKAGESRQISPTAFSRTFSGRRSA